MEHTLDEGAASPAASLRAYYDASCLDDSVTASEPPGVADPSVEAQQAFGQLLFAAGGLASMERNLPHGVASSTSHRQYLLSHSGYGQGTGRAGRGLSGDDDERHGDWHGDRLGGEDASDEPRLDSRFARPAVAVRRPLDATAADGSHDRQEVVDMAESAVRLQASLAELVAARKTDDDAHRQAILHWSRERAAFEETILTLKRRVSELEGEQLQAQKQFEATRQTERAQEDSRRTADAQRMRDLERAWETAEANLRDLRAFSDSRVAALELQLREARNDATAASRELTTVLTQLLNSSILTRPGAASSRPPSSFSEIAIATGKSPHRSPPSLEPASRLSDGPRDVEPVTAAGTATTATTTPTAALRATTGPSRGLAAKWLRSKGATPPKGITAPLHPTVPDALPSSPPRLPGPLAAPKTPLGGGGSLVPARAVVHDKNFVPPREEQYVIVESLEAELFRLCQHRDAIQEHFRRVEHIKPRSLAEMTRRDALARDLAAATKEVSAVRRKLREYAALER